MESLEIDSTADIDLSISGDDAQNTTITQTEMDQLEANTPPHQRIKERKRPPPAAALTNFLPKGKPREADIAATCLTP